MCDRDLRALRECVARYWPLDWFIDSLGTYRGRDLAPRHGTIG